MMECWGMARRSATLLESLVLAAILLSLVQTFLEDYAVLAAWPLLLRRSLQLAGFSFDLLFTMEFLARLHLAATDRRLGRYLGAERGWLDFLASVPLLIFVSGPWAASLLLGPAILPALSTAARAARTARLLRLLRAARVFGRLPDPASPMGRRHVTVAATIAVSVLVLGAVLFASLGRPLGLRATADATEQDQLLGARYLQAHPRALQQVTQIDGALLLLRQEGATRFSRYDDAYYAARFAPGDYGYLQEGGRELFYDLRPEARREAGQNLIYLGLALLLVLAFLLRYGPHFALTVTDPLQAMRRGLEEPGYNRPVEVPERYREDEVFRLARSYNEQYLPLKARARQGRGRAQPRGEQAGPEER
jgi:hypothetical protein